MKKNITFTATLIAAALFSGLANAASGEQSEDILYGSGAGSASMGAPYVQFDTGPKGTETDLLSNLHEVESSSSAYVPYVQVSGDRDNSDNLLDQVS